MIWPRDHSDDPFEESYQSLLEHAYFVGYRFFSRDKHLAEEVAQETLTRAYERWERVGRHPNPEAWVMNAAWKVSLEVQRRQSRAPATGPLEVESLGEDLVVERPLLINALAKLTKRQRNVAMARYYFGYDVAESARMLGMTEPQVRTASHEATLRLRGLLADRPATTATTPAAATPMPAPRAPATATPAKAPPVTATLAVSKTRRAATAAPARTADAPFGSTGAQPA